MNVIDMDTTDFLTKALEDKFIACHVQSAETPLDIKAVNAFVAKHLADLDELVTEFVTDRF